MSSGMLKRREAFNRIEAFKAQHSMHRFRECTNEHFDQHADVLAYSLRVKLDGNEVQVARRMRELAAQISDLDFEDPHSNGHHAQAAEAIVRLANDLEKGLCPWADLRHVFGDLNILRQLADCLWRHNPTCSWDWQVDLNVVTSEVWGDETTKAKIVRSAVSKLKKWFGEKGVQCELRVRTDTTCPHIRVLVTDVDDAKVEEAAAARGDADCLDEAGPASEVAVGPNQASRSL